MGNKTGIWFPLQIPVCLCEEGFGGSRVDCEKGDGRACCACLCHSDIELEDVLLVELVAGPAPR